MILLVGPTASGKTEAGLALARERNGEIISVDSRQVYRELCVGTAKPVHPCVPYHLIDFLDPKESFSAMDFAKRASALIADISKRGKTPILVGGTGFYFRALLEGLAPLPPADPALRESLRAEAERKGRAALHQRLASVDPVAAKNIPANNIQRLIRALEVYELTGKPITVWHQEHKKRPSAPLETIGLDPGREELNRRIQKRAEAMLAGGMIEETDALLKRGFPETAPGLTGLGYPRVIDFLKKKMSRGELLQSIVQDTRQYAKRQMTWFRNQMEVSWKKS